MGNAGKEIRASLNSEVSRQFLLRDVVVVSCSCRCHQRFDEAPKGTFDIQYAFKLDSQKRENEEGLVLLLRCDVKGYSQVGGKRARRKKSFSVDLVIEGFFETAGVIRPLKKFTNEQVYQMVAQLHPLLVSKSREQLVGMGYQGIDVPFQLTLDEIQSARSGSVSRAFPD